MKIYIVVTYVVNNVTYSRKRVNTYVVIALFYYMTLSTGKQRRHTIKISGNDFCDEVTLTFLINNCFLNKKMSK